MSIPAAAQELDQQNSVDWAVALGGRFRDLHNSVIGSHGLASLASLVCPHNPTAAAGLFGDALARLNNLPSTVFSETRQLLPVASLSELWTFLRANARRCNAGIDASSLSGITRSRMASERAQANDTLLAAMDAIDDNPDRAAQLARAAIGAGDPWTLDISQLTLFLSRLRAVAADLTDDLFPMALNFIVLAEGPSPGQLSELGNYLFTAARYLERPDREQASDSIQVGDSTIYDHGAIRHSANPDDVRAYMEAALKLLATEDRTNFDPTIAYAIADQLLAKARVMAEDLAEPLDKARTILAAEAGGNAAQIDELVGAGGVADPNAGESAIRRERAIGFVMNAISGGRFAEARETLRDVGDSAIQSQLDGLIDFREACDAIHASELDLATRQANGLRGGVKRALLYAGIMANGSRETAHEELQLAAKDVESLPAEQRVYLLSAIAAAMLRVDEESALVVLNQAVTALNDARSRPRRGRFDPKVMRRTFHSGGSSTTDSSLILLSSRGLYEVIDSGWNRRNFQLRVPGISAMALPAVIRQAGSIDPKRLEAVLLGLRDELDLASALLSLAALRLGPPSGARPPIE